jgi:hypothetical protein
LPSPPVCRRMGGGCGPLRRLEGMPALKELLNRLSGLEERLLHLKDCL